MAEQSLSEEHSEVSYSTQTRLLHTLEQLLAIDATEVGPALDEATDLLVPALRSEKIDVFLYTPESDSLQARGTSHTPMGNKQHALGLDYLPVSNGGRTVGVYKSGEPYFSNAVAEDKVVLKGIRESLGVRSMMVVPMVVNGEKRGVLAACSAQPGHYTEDDLNFLLAVSNWVGAIVHRAELSERLRWVAVDEARRVTAQQLITVLAHDLGNRLTPAMGRIDIIRRNARREGNESYLRSAEAARKALEQLDDMIKDLLDVSRLERGLFSLTYSRVEMTALVEEVVEGMKPTGASIKVMSPGDLWADADAARVRQALENLVSNAVKHGPRGVPVRVEVTQEKWRDEDTIVVTVTDEGPGIDPDILPNLFTPFAAGSGSTGLGIGLYLAYQIARAHGGELQFESKIGIGTTFCLRIPVTPPADI